MPMVSKFKEIIDERGVKQSFICDRTGLNKTTVSKLYTYGRIPSYETAYKIAKLLGVPMEEIWYIEE